MEFYNANQIFVADKAAPQQRQRYNKSLQWIRSQGDNSAEQAAIKRSCCDCTFNSFLFNIFYPAATATAITATEVLRDAAMELFCSLKGRRLAWILPDAVKDHCVDAPPINTKPKTAILLQTEVVKPFQNLSSKIR